MQYFFIYFEKKLILKQVAQWATISHLGTSFLATGGYVILFHKFYDFSMTIQVFSKFHDFSMHGTFFRDFPGFP